jgi:hypothetical protein
MEWDWQTDLLTDWLAQPCSLLSATEPQYLPTSTISTLTFDPRTMLSSQGVTSHNDYNQNSAHFSCFYVRITIPTFRVHFHATIPTTLIHRKAILSHLGFHLDIATVQRWKPLSVAVGWTVGTVCPWGWLTVGSGNCNRVADRLAVYSRASTRRHKNFRRTVAVVNHL